MKSSNKLNKALKEALHENPGPLQDKQWERLRAELEEKKRRGVFWYFLGLGLFILAGIGVWFFNFSNEKVMADEKIYHIQSSQDSSNESLSMAHDTAMKLADSEKNNLKSNPASGSLPESNKVQESIPTENTALISSQTQSNTTEPVNNVNGANTTEKEKSGFSDKGLVNGAQKDFVEIGIGNRQGVPEKSDTFERLNVQAQKSMPHLNEKDLDTSRPKADDLVGDGNENGEVDAKDTEKKPEDEKISKKKPKAKKSVKAPGENPPGRFVLGFAAGISSASTKVTGLSNENMLHKDTREVFKMNNSRQSSYFLNLGFEYKFSSLGLRLNTGLNFRNLSSESNFKYTLNELPFRNRDNTIAFYLQDTSSDPLVFHVASKNTFTFLTIPIQFSYGLPLNSNYELIFSAGINFSGLIASSGKTLDMNDYEVKSLRSSIRQKYSLGYSGGMQLSRRITGPWWLGLEAGYGTVNLSYDLKYGVLKSRIGMTGINLNLRYKLN